MSALVNIALNPTLYDLNARVVFFPVRHHSPTAARIVRELIESIRPAVVLIEGPVDYNPHIAELRLPHQLPIAIYSYAKLENGLRRGAFYPFCIYSPEWVAVQTAGALNIPAQFIDLPWAHIATSVSEQSASNRYADGALQSSNYIKSLCESLGVENFDDLWDTLFEIEALTPAAYVQRAHQLCFYMRVMDREVSPVDTLREQYMATLIRAAMSHYDGRVLVVTGGFHSAALFDLIAGEAMSPIEPERSEPEREAIIETGIALTPFSYERLDNLRGYASGMPNPGFYHEVWLDSIALTPPELPTHRKLLGRVATKLRAQRQTVSAADLIAVETTARALADLRGHARVWRRDLIDGVMGALVKEEVAYAFVHPFLEAVHEVFRGYERGRLATGTTLPPLVQHIAQVLKTNDLQMSHTERLITLDLARNLSRNRILNQLRVLMLPGYELVQAFDLDSNADRLEEVWRIRWRPEFDAACIEASIYGPTLEDAAHACLEERAEQVTAAETPNAAHVVDILLDAVLVGLPVSASPFYGRLSALIAQDGNFFTVAAALTKLLYCYRFDTLLGVAGDIQAGDLLRTNFRRALWLLESLGAVSGQDRALLDGVRTLHETYERCQPILSIALDDFGDVFERCAADSAQLPLMRGAAHGVLWLLGKATALTQTVQFFATPEQLGDFLTGLFALARETMQREPALVQQIDGVLMGYEDDGFLTALPALRLAFSYFLPREKYYLTRTLFEGEPEVLTTPLEVSDADAARALAFESRLFKAMSHYGVLTES